MSDLFPSGWEAEQLDKARKQMSEHGSWGNLAKWFLISLAACYGVYVVAVLLGAPLAH